VAVVDANGSGKTTLLALLPRFYDPQSGESSSTARHPHRLAQFLRARSRWSPGTASSSRHIAGQHRYGLPLIAREQDHPRRKTRLRATTSSWKKPNGYDNPPRRLGGQLSGGQKQRLCIAARSPQCAVLVLDEATSQVDAESDT